MIKSKLTSTNYGSEKLLNSTNLKLTCDFKLTYDLKLTYVLKLTYELKLTYGFKLTQWPQFFFSAKESVKDII